MNTTRARSGDPETSHAAATAQTPTLRASQARVLNMFKVYGDLHDKQLLAYLQDAEKSIGLKPMSPSGARSRRSELSKPNMDRLEEMMEEWTTDVRALSHRDPTAEEVEAAMELARARLRQEGFRSPLWDTGRREKVDGHSVIVWGLAR